MEERAAMKKQFQQEVAPEKIEEKPKEIEKEAVRERIISMRDRGRD